MRSPKSFSSISSTGGWGFDVEECEEQNSRNTAIQSGPARRRKGRLAGQNGQLSSEATRMRKARNAMKPPTGAHRLGWRAPEESREAKPPLAASSSRASTLSEMAGPDCTNDEPRLPGRPLRPHQQGPKKVRREHAGGREAHIKNLTNAHRSWAGPSRRGRGARPSKTFLAGLESRDRAAKVM